MYPPTRVRSMKVPSTLRVHRARQTMDIRSMRGAIHARYGPQRTAVKCTVHTRTLARTPHSITFLLIARS